MSSLLAEYANRIRRFSPNARLFLLSIFGVGLASSIFSLFLNIYLLRLGYKQDFIGLMAAIPPLVIAFLSVPAGVVGDSIGHRRALILGAAFSSLGALGLVLFTKPEPLVLSIGILGLGSALTQVVSAPFMIEESRESERPHLFSVQFALQTLAGFFGSFLGGALPSLFALGFALTESTATVYQMTLAVGTGLIGLSVLPLLGMRSTPRASSRTELRWRLKTPPRLVFKLILPNMILGLGAGLFIPFINVFFKLQFHISDELLGALFAWSAVGMGVASLAGPPLAQRIGRVRMIVLTQALSIPFLIAMAFVPILWVSALAFVIRYALMPMSAPIYSLFVMEQVAPEDRATVNGWSTMAWNLLFAGSAWLSGQLQIVWGFRPIFVIVCAVYSISIALQYKLFAPLEHHEI
ncbi:MAG: MFS transporter [Candidatus Bipolaricaulota bacterium]|nr:MFS transporter [Candidatus Bipolaricaulota bacterium]MDW8031428.1 MFS transporter [Candidatus Bipolaricaulota bacterium]